MPRLTDQQSSVIANLFTATPEAALRELEQALSGEVEQGGALAQVHELIEKEANDRRVRAAVLGPVIPLCRPSDLGDMRFSGATIRGIWSGLRAAHPERVAAAEAACLDHREGARARDKIYDELCVRAAKGLRRADPAFAAASQALAGAGEGATAMFAGYLDLVPLARPAITQLPEWLGRMSDERAAVARLAYKDAVALSDEAGPRLIEMLLAHLPEPWRILRILAAVVTRANDNYLASSELERFGGYILGDIARRLAAVRAFDPDDGREAGVEAAEHLHVAAQELAEFEMILELSRDGPWGRRVAKEKRTLAELAEARLAKIEKAVDQALPLRMVRFGRGLKGAPRLTTDPDPRLVRRAQGLMGFFDRSQTSATSSGFGAARAKVGKKLEARLDRYVEDLLEAMQNVEAVDLGRIHAYLDIAASFIGDVRGDRAAQLVRRRAEAA